MRALRALVRRRSSERAYGVPGAEPTIPIPELIWNGQSWHSRTGQVLVDPSDTRNVYVGALPIRLCARLDCR